MDKTKAFIRDLWALLRPYWTSEERRGAWLLLGANITPAKRVAADADKDSARCSVDFHS